MGVTKGKLLTASLLAAGCLWGATAHSEIEVLEDRFDGQVTVRTTVRTFEARPSLFLIGRADKGATTGAILGLGLTSDSWRYLTCHRTDWLLDGKRFKMSPALHKGSVGQGYVIEHLIFMVSRDQLLQLSKGNSIEYKICNDEYSLNDTERADLREFIKRSDEYRRKTTP
jgi:hypothetical protein